MNLELCDWKVSWVEHNEVITRCVIDNQLHKRMLKWNKKHNTNIFRGTINTKKCVVYLKNVLWNSDAFCHLLPKAIVEQPGFCLFVLACMWLLVSLASWTKKIKILLKTSPTNKFKTRWPPQLVNLNKHNASVHFIFICLKLSVIVDEVVPNT